METLISLPACEYAIAGRPLAGERKSGDAALVLTVGHRLLVAVVDGLGHGDEAAMAAEVALATLRQHADEPLTTLFKQCHERLQTTRGVAAVLAVLDTLESTLVWAGVGNVEAVLVAAKPGARRAKQWLTNRGGVVGYRLPVVEARAVPILVGDLLIIATDGIDEGFVAEELQPDTPENMAHSILEQHGKAADDALVLVLRWLGGTAGVVLSDPL